MRELSTRNLMLEVDITCLPLHRRANEGFHGARQPRCANLHNHQSKSFFMARDSVVQLVLSGIIGSREIELEVNRVQPRALDAYEPGGREQGCNLNSRDAAREVRKEGCGQFPVEQKIQATVLRGDFGFGYYSW